VTKDADPVEAGTPAATPVLPCLKRQFPFRLGTTSYIIPADLAANLRLLGPCLDEVELVLYECAAGHNLPTPAEVRELAALAVDLELRLNVHLPGDLFFADPEPRRRRQFCDTALRFYERTLPLQPTAYILHLDSRWADGTVESDPQVWHHRLAAALTTLQDQGMDLQQVLVENLEYPLARLLPLAETFQLGLCLDVGHLLRYDHDVASHLDEFLEHCPMVHLHGVNQGEDHLGVQHLPEALWDLIRRQLAAYQGTVLLEIFSLHDLLPSLERMEQLRQGDSK